MPTVRCCSPRRTRPLPLHQDGKPSEDGRRHGAGEHPQGADAVSGPRQFRVSVASQLSTDKRQTNETVYDPESRAERSVRNVREKRVLTERGSFDPTTVQQNLPDQQVNSGGTKNSSEDKNPPRGRHQLRSLIQDYDDGKRRLFRQEALHRRPGQSSPARRRSRRQEQPGHRRQQARRDQPACGDRRGLDKTRGDQIQVTAVDFIEGSRELAPVPPISFVEMINKQLGSVINAVTILAVASMLVWFGLRPAVNGILTHRAQQSRPRRPRPRSSKLRRPCLGRQSGPRAQPRGRP